jgi:excisionase family DNA binding protein
MYELDQKRFFEMEILTTKEACSLLKTKRLTLYKLVKSGEIPAFRMGRAWKFERTAIEAWIRKRLEENNKAIKP